MTHPPDAMPNPSANLPGEFPEFADYPFDNRCDNQISLRSVAPWLAGWMKYLLDPPIVGHGPNDPPQPKIDGLDYADMFYPSDVLSGQKLDYLADFWQSLETTRFRGPDGQITVHVFSDLKNALNDMIGGWKTGDVSPVQDYRDQLDKYDEAFVDTITKLEQHLATYTAIIDRARADLAKHMLQTVQTLERYHYETTDPQRQRLWALELVGNFAREAFPWTKEAPGSFQEIFQTALTSTASAREEYNDLPAGGFQEIMDAYRAVANKICDDARESIETLIGEVRNIPKKYAVAEPPALPH